MILDDHDFRKLLAAAFQKIRAEGSRPRLTNPTRGSIRKECNEVFQARVEPRDVPILETFFGPPQNGTSMLRHIQKFDLDRLRPFYNYLHDTSIDTEHKNVDLLAWLIDFPYRPNRLGNQVLLTDEEKLILGIQQVDGSLKDEKAGGNDGTGAIVEERWQSRAKEDEKDEMKTAGPAPTNTGYNEKEVSPALNAGKAIKDRLPRWAKAGALVIGIGAVCSGGYAIISPLYQEKCMYWAGDHYEKVRCDEEANGRFIIPVEKNQLKVQRINREDTIREEHIGKLFYIQHNNDIQYYTQKGQYPEDLGRDLQKLSRIIFDKDSVNRKAALKQRP